MILSATQRPGAGRVALDHLIQSNAERSGDQVALYDAPDRPLWTEGAPRRLTWAQLDAATSAVASRLVELGLGTDAIVAIQGPNASDTLVAALGCMKANLVPALLPANWRNAEATQAVARLGVKAIFAATRAGSAHPADTLRYVAADNFSVRFICGFGAETPDGVVPFEDCIADPRAGRDVVRGKRLGNPAEHVAAITFDCGASGFFPVARTHNEWLAAGLALLTDTGLARESVLLSTLSPCAFAGLATGLVPWLMTGCTLVLHQAFDAMVLDVQIGRHEVTHAVLPDVAIEAARRDSLFEAPSLRSLTAVSRRPDQTAPALQKGATLQTVAVFGELGLVASSRDEAGVTTLPSGIVTVPRNVEGAPESIEIGVSSSGVLTVRGAMVPRAPFPGADKGGPYPMDAEGFVSTGFPAEAQEDGTIRVTGPRRDIVAIGGHSLALAQVDALYADASGALSVNAAAVEDPILGQRLALSAMPAAGKDLSASSLVIHAEEKGVSPLAMSADVAIGDRRRGTRLAGAA